MNSIHNVLFVLQRLPMMAASITEYYVCWVICVQLQLRRDDDDFTKSFVCSSKKFPHEEDWFCVQRRENLRYWSLDPLMIHSGVLINIDYGEEAGGEDESKRVGESGRRQVGPKRGEWRRTQRESTRECDERDVSEKDEWLYWLVHW